MKRSLKNLMVCLFVTTIFVVSYLPMMVLAASNPYPSSQTIGGVTTIPCTYYAWQQAYDNTGVAMPNFGNAKNWYTSASNNGYSVGSTPKAKSIAVWTNSGYGHVAYVVSVNGSKITVNEGGMLNTNGTAYNGNGIINGSVCNSAVGSKKSSYSSSVLVGYIYLNNSTTSSSSSVKVTSTPEKNTIADTNAILWGRVDKPSNYAVTKIGIRVRKDGSTYDKGWSKYETPSKNYVGSTYMQPYFNMNTELGVTLTHASKYWFQFYAVVNGSEYWSSEYYFTTTGSHSYNSWSTVKSATCTVAGSKTRKCKGCSKTETQTIAALGHNYSTTYTIDKAATCTVNGTKSKHCSRCDSITSVTVIAAKGHSFTSWNTTKNSSCTTNGTKERKCSNCTYRETQSISALDHSWSNWKVTKAATTKVSGEKRRECTRSNCTVYETITIAKLAEDGHTHNFGEWKTVANNSCTVDGLMKRECSVCKKAEEKTVAAIGHSFGEWTVKTQATTNNEGVTERICVLCGEKEQDKIPKIIEESDNTDAKNNMDLDGTKPKAIDKKLIIGVISFLLLSAAAVIVVILIRKRKK